MREGGLTMSRGAAGRRWALTIIAILAPIMAVAAWIWAQWGQLALEAVQVALKMAVIP